MNVDGVKVAYYTSATDIVEIDNDFSVITALAAGEAEIIAEWTETATYNAGSTKFNILVSAPKELGDIIVTCNGETFEDNGEYTLNEGDEVTISAANAEKITITDFINDESHDYTSLPVVRVPKVGENGYTITAYLGKKTKEISFVLNVLAASTDPVEYNPNFEDIEIEEFQTLQLDLGKKRPYDLIFISNDKAVVTVSETGLITAVAPGETTIEYLWEDEQYLPADDEDYTINVKVTEKARVEYAPAFAGLASTGLQLTTDDATYRLDLGETHPESMLFKSSDESVATIDENTGLISVKKAGTTTISCDWDRDATFTAGRLEFTLTVTEPVKIIFSKDDGFVSAEETKGGVTLTWDKAGASNNINFGRSDGTVGFMGKATLTIKSPAGYFLEKVIFENANESSYPFALTSDKGTCDNSSKIWSTTEDVAKVVFTQNSTKQVQIKKITVYLKKGDPVEVAMAWKDKGGNAVESLSTAINADLTGFFPELEVSVADAKSAVVYSSTNEDVATIAADGNITLVGVGETTITASIPEGNDTFLPVQAEYTLTVTEAEKHDYEAPFAGKTYDLTTDDSAVALDLGTRHPEKIAFKTSDANVAEVITEEDESGERKAYIKINGVGSAVITASWGVDDNYSASSLEAPVTFTVNVTKVVGPKTVTFDVSALKKVEYNGDNTEATGGNQQVTLLWAKKSQTAALTQNFTQSPSDVRLYKNNELKISVGDNFYIERIEFTTESSNKLTDDTNVDVGTIDVSGQLWKNVDADNNEVEPSAVTFVCGAQIRMTRIKVIYHPRGAKPVTMEWSAEAVEFALNAELESKLPVLTVNPEKALSYITYSIEKAEDAEGEVASIDPVTGEIKLLSVGVATVTASTDGEVYEAASASYTLTVTKAEAQPFNPPFLSLIGDGKIKVTNKTNILKLDLGKTLPKNFSVTSVNKENEDIVVAEVLDIVQDEEDEHYYAQLKIMWHGETEITCKWEGDDNYLADELKFALEVGHEHQAVVLVYKGKTYTGTVANRKDFDNTKDELPYVISGVATFNMGKYSVSNDFRPYANSTFTITSANGITIEKVVFKYTNDIVPTIIDADGKGNVSVDFPAGVVTWNGEATGDIRFATDKILYIPYIEIYYYEEPLNPNLTKVDLKWTLAEPIKGNKGDVIDIPADELSVMVDGKENAEARKAVRFHCELPDIASVDMGAMTITFHAEGQTHLVACIPDDNETYAANDEPRELISDDPYVIDITAKWLGGKQSYAVYTQTHTDTNMGIDVEFTSVYYNASDLIQLNTKTAAGSGVVVSSNNGKRLIESIEIDFETVGSGVKVYSSNKAFIAPEKDKAVKVEGAMQLNEDDAVFAVNAPAFAIVPAGSGAIKINKIRVTYSAEELAAEVNSVECKVEHLDLEAATVEGGKLHGTGVDRAFHYSIGVQGTTNVPAMLFQYGEHQWVAEAYNGAVDVDVTYLPVPEEKEMELQYCALLDANDPETKMPGVGGKCPIAFDRHVLLDKAAVEIADNILVARYNNIVANAGDIVKDENGNDKVLTDKDAANMNHDASNRVILDLQLSHVLMVNESKANHEPCLIAYEATNGNGDKFDVEYNTTDHTALIKDFAGFDFIPSRDYSEAIAKKLANLELNEAEHSVTVSAEVFFPVIYDKAGPVITVNRKNPAPGRKFIKAETADVKEPVVAAVKPANADGSDDDITSTGSIAHTDINKLSNDGIVTGLENVLVEAEEAEAEYFNLQGVKIAHPAKGQVVICRQGSKVEKMVIK